MIPESGIDSELLIDRRGPLLRAAVVTDGLLTDLHVDRCDLMPSGLEGDPSRLPSDAGRARPRPWLRAHERVGPPSQSDTGDVSSSWLAGVMRPQTGSVWRGRVERISAGLNAAFVDLGTGPSGLLGAVEVRLAGGRRPESGAAIGSLLRSGQTVLVQVKAEAVGTKGPTLAMDVSLPGRVLVHAPFRRGVTVSRRIGQGAARGALTRRLQALTTGDGWIARAGAEGAADALIAAESEALACVWRDLERAAAAGTAPALLAAAPDAGRRAVIGHGLRPLSRIVVAYDSDLQVGWAEDFMAWCRDAAPDLALRLETHSGAQPLFDRHDLESQFLALAGSRVPLTGGAGLVIERTEALSVVDVNGGERGNPLAVNLEAAREVARQLRLRNLCGIIIVDFVSMPRRGDGERVLDALAAAVADDPIQTEVHGMSKLGLVELTRARRGPMLIDLLSGYSESRL